MIIVFGSIVIRADAIDRAIELSREHVARSRAEEGCISHAVHHDCENPRRLVFVEEWVDRASLDRHFEVPESVAFVAALTALASEPPQMRVYEADPLAEHGL